jgi:hypothetical protein
VKDWKEELEVKVEVGIVSAGGISSIVGVGVCKEKLEVKVEVEIASIGGISSIVGVGVGAEVGMGSSSKS